MPSWIREKDGEQWYDEPYASSISGLTPKRLASLAKARKIRSKRLGRPLVLWYAVADVDALRAQSLANKAEGVKPKRRKKTPEQEEQAWARMARETRFSSRSTSAGVSRHYDHAIIAETLAAAAAKRKKDKGE